MIEQLINKQVSSDTAIIGMLTAYKGEPAFFYQKSPQDGDRGWTKLGAEPRSCYPRADFNVDMRYDPERKTAGVLSINVWCTNESAAMPEDIEKRLVELIGGTFYTGTDRTTICAVWNRSDAFNFESKAMNAKGEPEVFGITAVFDLTEFPVQITTTPDPIQGVNLWTKNNFPQMAVIAFDEMPPIWKPTDQHPAIYWRFLGMDSSNKQGYDVTWYNGHFAAHVIASSVTERNKWTKAIIEKIQLEQEFILEDTSPMFVHQIAGRHNADPLREGQIAVTGQYGVLAGHRKGHAEMKLIHPYFNSAKED